MNALRYQFSNALHPGCNALRTSLMAASAAAAVLLTSFWALRLIGAA